MVDWLFLINEFELHNILSWHKDNIQKFKDSKVAKEVVWNNLYE